LTSPNYTQEWDARYARAPQRDGVRPRVKIMRVGSNRNAE